MTKRFVVLTPAEDAQADEVGKGRSDANERAGRGDRRSYDPTKIMTDNVLANQLAARCELGVAKYYGAEWFGKVWDVSDHAAHAHEPDCQLGSTGIEVKWRRTGGWGVPVDRKDAERGHLIVWASVAPGDKEFITTVTIHGEALASELWDAAKDDERGDERRRYAQPVHLQTAGTYFASVGILATS